VHFLVVTGEGEEESVRVMLTWHFWNSNLNGTPVGKLKNHMRI
jgi:hypothetical protein